MKLLLDANLSWRLVKKLENAFQVVEHVSKTGLPIPANDRAIWNWAKANDFAIVTNDEDFANLLVLRGFPPKIILIRRGNQTTGQLASLILASQHEIEAIGQSKINGLLEIY